MIRIFQKQATRRQICLGITGSLVAAAVADEQVPSTAAYDPFVIYYGQHAVPALDNFKLQVLDSEIAETALSSGASALRLGYLSLVEASQQRSYHAELASLGILGRANPNWPDANYIDARDERWHNFVIQSLIPGILKRGFGGIFLDTLDNAEYLEVTAPSQYHGMIKGAGTLITSIRKSFPDIKIMINRGYGTLPLVAGHFDMLLGESVVSRFTPDRRYEFLSRDDVEWQKAQMYSARDRDPTLRLFSLDYWSPEDGETIASIYTIERKNGFIPYVATWDLGSVVQHAEAKR